MKRLSAAVTLVTLLSNLAHAQDNSCTTPPPITLYKQPVSINTDVLTNGTFAPVPGYNVAITNAPTSINTLTTLTWTTSLTDGGPSPGAPAPADASDASSLTSGSTFYLVMTPIFARVKRQAGFSYISTDGSATGNCANAPTYSLVNGQLFAYQNGITYQFSATPGTAYTKFIPTTIPGPITTTFSFDSGSLLSWTNPLFFNGEAAFCSMANGTVYAVFQENGQPFGCFYIALSLYSQSTCQAAAVVSAAALPAVTSVVQSVVTQVAQITGPQGMQGPIGPQDEWISLYNRYLLIPRTSSWNRRPSR